MADVLQTEFNLDSSATNAVTGKTLYRTGTPTVTYDTTLKRNVATIDGSGGYALLEMYRNYPLLTDSFTLETYVYVESKPSKSLNIISNMESGGFGFQFNSAGQIQILCHGTSGYDRASTTLPLNQWVHVVGVYTGSKIQIYINGVLQNEVNASKTSWTLPANGAQYLSVGGDSSPTAPGGTNFFTGKMAAANLYSDALTAAEIAALYAKY